jgi:hypothetical protein
MQQNATDDNSQMKTHKNDNKSKLRHVTNNAVNIGVVKLTRKKPGKKKKKKKAVENYS